MIDLTRWFVMPSVSEGYKLPNGTVYGRETHHLEGTKPDGSAAEKDYHIDTGYSLWFIKSLQGYPWDIKPYDSMFIYDRVTELNWTSPRDFKQFNPMLPMCPRFWDEGPWTNQIETSNYEVWQNCQKTSNANVSQVKYELIDAGNVNFYGDVGEIATLVLRYYWDGGGSPTVFNDLEELYLTERFGWVKWTHAKLQGGVYYIDDATLHNKIVAGGPPVRQFPCVKIP